MRGAVGASNRVMAVQPDVDASTRPAFWAGLGGALIGATCCIGPAVGVALGASAGSFLLALRDYRFLAFGLGAAVAAVAIWLALRRRRASCPSDASFRAMRSRWIDVALLTFGITYAVGRFVVPRVIELI
jgi:hypothetical protein